MIILKYTKKNHNQIILSCVHALRLGKVVAYPTDTSYGLAASVLSKKGLDRLYKIKERQATKPVHVVLPSFAYGKKIVEFNKFALKLARTFLPGALTLVLPLKEKKFMKLTGGSGSLGVRMPKNKVALDLAKYLGAPITATSANPSAHLSGGFDSYSVKDIINQFQKKKYKPDIILDAGTLPKRKPSTVVKVAGNKIEFLRIGPISPSQIKKPLTTNH